MILTSVGFFFSPQFISVILFPHLSARS